MKPFKEDNNSSPLGTNQSGMRAYNEKLVLTHLRNYGALPKAELARITGLSAQTVSVIMRALEEDGLLIKHEPIRGKIGQPSVPIALNPNGAFFLGLKIGRRSAELVLIDFMGKLRAHESMAYAFPTPDAVIEFTISAYDKISSLVDPTVLERIGGIGVAMPFELWNWADMIGVEPEKMASWRDFDIVSELQSRFSMPVYMQNDANAACGAELTFGEVTRPSNFLYLYIGHFVGGGIVLRDKLFKGTFGNAGAIGSIMVSNADGRSVQLIETSSIATLEHMLAARNLDTRLVWQVDRSWDIPADIFEDWLRQNAAGLAQAIHAAQSVLDFEAVVIDGWLPIGIAEKLASITDSEYQKLNQSGIHSPLITSGSIGKNARPLGAASLPLFDKYMVS